MIEHTNRLTRENIGFLLAKSSQRWNELLYAYFCSEGYDDIRPSYGSILIPLFEQEGLNMKELARRASLSKQTMTTMINLMTDKGLVKRTKDPDDQRSSLIFLTERSKSFRPVAERVLSYMDELVNKLIPSEELAILQNSLEKIINVNLPLSKKKQESG